MTSVLPTLPPAILARCLDFSEHLFATKPGTVKLEISPSHFVFSINQNPAKDPGNSFPQPSPSFPQSSLLPKRKKTPSDLRRNALRKAEFLKRKNPIPQAETENSPNPNVQISPSVDKSTISSSEEHPKKAETKEDPTEKLLSETILMDTSPDLNVILQPSVPVIQTRNNSSESESRHVIPPLISPVNSPPEKAKDFGAIQLIFCANNLKEATQLAERNFPRSKFKGIESKNPNHFNFLSLLKLSEIPAVLEAINDLNIVQFKTHPDKMTYSPEKPHHCQDCQVLRQK